MSLPEVQLKQHSIEVQPKIETIVSVVGGSAAKIPYVHQASSMRDKYQVS